MAKARRSFCYDYPRPALTVDVIIWTIINDKLDVLLIQRGSEPFAGKWALPGGFVDENEPLEKAALRELVEETGVRGIGLEQSQAFGDPGRDPRGWTVSVTFQVLLNAAKVKPRAADDAAAVDWFPISKLPALAFDHAKIIAAGLEQLRSQRLRTPLGLHLLPKRFVLFDLKRIHEAVLGQRLDMINFRRELTGRGIVRCVRVGARSWYEFTRPMRAD